ncbi:PREDICTED: caprin homolog [Bactrocera latifrons]|uniref:Caprin n=1 Tax=Bactrocera latifrons TaxID=174628 RepID=A0A0K8WBJ7_BACLA|nr:PREDICTED: caprin homolog [Bactrocera latifrons]
MPSASNKLEKQASIGSVHGTGGGNNVTGSGATKKSQDVVNSNSNTMSENNANSTVLNNNIANSTTNEGSVTSTSTNTKGVATNPVLEANIPMKQTITTIDHKIRNLEKRKTKLESYRTIQASGKELSSDQKAAVAKYDAVIAMLEFARDFSKQMWQFVKEAEKEQRKQARKDLITRALAETAKIREALVIQNIINCFEDETIRADFLNGANGALKLETADITILDKFCCDVRMTRPETVDDVPFVTAAQKAAELYSMTIDGRPKVYAENFTYDQIRLIFNKIQESGYLDKIYMATPEVEVEVKEEDEVFSNSADGEDVANADEIYLEEGLEKLNVSSIDVEDDLDDQNANAGLIDDAVLQATVAGNVNDLPQQQQQQPNLPQQLVPQQTTKEHLDVQQVQGVIQPPQTQQQQPLNAVVIQPANAVTGGVPPNFPAPLQGTPAAPVHVAMFTAQQMQGAPPQMQQVPPGSIIGVPQVPPQMVPIAQAPPQQQRQLMTSPGTQAAAAQLPQGAIPIHGAPQPPPGHFTPTTVRAVEQGLFPHNRQQFIQQQMRPVAEIIGNGSFYFLQESELDSPELSGNAPIGSVVFEQQQQQPPQQTQQQPPISQDSLSQAQQLQQQNILVHGGELQAAELLKNQQQHHLQQQQQIVQQQQQQQQAQQSQPQQTIPTQTFTNQSFPPMQAAASVTAPTSANSSNTPTIASNNPSPMFPQQQQQQKHPQLFSPVGGPGMQPQDAITAHKQQLLLTEQQQAPIMIMARMAAPQARLAQQNAQQQQQLPQVPQQAQPPQPTLGMQPGDVRVSDVTAGGYLGFDNGVVGLAYEQQMQQQLAVVAKASAAAAAAAAAAAEELKVNEDLGTHSKFNASESVIANEWDAMSKATAASVRAAANISSTAVTNATATAALANALKSSSGVSSSSSVAGASNVLEPPTKWSAEMNALSNPSTPSGNSDNTPAIVRKIEWTSSNSSGGAGSGSGAGPSVGGSGGGYGDGNQSSSNAHESNHWNSNQQQDGGHYNNGRQFQRRRGRGSYGNSQQNGSGRGGSGIYFRNNENSSSGSYYQNGGGNVYSNKDSGSRYESGNYRGPRGSGGGNGGGGAGNGRGNGPPSRTLGGRNGSGGQSNPSSGSYMNRSSQRIPMSLDNKN